MNETEAPAERRGKRDPYKIAHRGPVFHFFWPFTRYVVTHLFVFVSVFFFEVLNRTVVIGKDNVGEEPNTVLLPNHQSMIDGFLVGYAVYFPRSLANPMLLPWMPAAWENFFKHPVMRWFGL
ncbi:MAG: 1-acyl-sn-glycerol-3-phosphate acyltransferase, partial [Elusimicrobia bacterium]|nr:1-acyl-sn-glycerol-3-phosphate acyltransferase [Elusimicrobiota bacterium]